MGDDLRVRVYYFLIHPRLEVQMRDTITVSLPSEVKSEVDAFAEQNGLARSDVVRDALQEYLFFRRSRELRARMMAEAQAQGLFTDDDIFDRIS